MTPKFKDKGKKVLEAKAAWDRYKGKKTIVVNNLADDFSLKGGKWMCHLPTSMIDRPGVCGESWQPPTCTGGLGPSVYMVFKGFQSTVLQFCFTNDIF